MISSVSPFGIDQLLIVFFERWIVNIPYTFLRAHRTELNIFQLYNIFVVTIFFYSPTVYQKINFDQAAVVFNDPKYYVKLPNILYVPGYQDSPFSASSQLIIDAYFKLGGHNVFALDWSTLANVPYPRAVVNAIEVKTQIRIISKLNFENVVTFRPEQSWVVFIYFSLRTGSHLVFQKLWVMTSEVSVFRLWNKYRFPPSLNKNFSKLIYLAKQDEQ